MPSVVLPVLIALGVLGILTIGTLFGAWLVESEYKRRAKAAEVPLMEVVDAG